MEKKVMLSEQEALFFPFGNVEGFLIIQYKISKGATCTQFLSNNLTRIPSS